MTSDLLTLTGLRVFGRHGVHDYERRNGQEFVVDVVLRYDAAAAATSDDVADTVDYGELATELAEIVGGEPVNLLEALADRLATACLRHPLVRAATVTVHKPYAPILVVFDDVSVTVTRSRE